MKTLERILFSSIHACALIAMAVSIHAQQVQATGEPGSPSATTTIDGKQLPAPPPKFGGVIKEDAKDSKPWWPPQIVPPKGAPNILLIMTDDSGYGVPSTFGGVIPTPTLDRVAKDGLRYTAKLRVVRAQPTRPQPDIGLRGNSETSNGRLACLVGKF